MSNDLQNTNGGHPLLQFDPSKIDVIRSTVAKGATDNELEMFLHLCKTYQLDPFRKEIWFIKYGEKKGNNEPTIMTSRDGYLKIAQQHPDYLGIMSQEVRENDYFELDASKGLVSHRFAQPISSRGQIVGAWATAKRKGVDPVSIFVNFHEYRGNSKIWAHYPSAMIIKVAESFALKRQFGITGLVTREEMDAQDQDAQMAHDQSYGQAGTNSSMNGQTPQNGSQGGQSEVIPSNKEVLDASKILGWSSDQMLANVNAFLQKNQQPPVKAWKEVHPSYRYAFYQIMCKRIQKLMGF